MITETDELMACSRAHIAACPTCTAVFTLHRSPTPHMDECGFESYTIECSQCGTTLSSIVDPTDETLLVSEVAAYNDVIKSRQVA